MKIIEFDIKDGKIVITSDTQEKLKKLKNTETGEDKNNEMQVVNENQYYRLKYTIIKYISTFIQIIKKINKFI